MDPILDAINDLRIKLLSTKTETDFVIVRRLDRYLDEAANYINLAKYLAAEHKIEL